MFCLHTAMLISGYVTEHPNKEQEAQWQSCLSAIITDCHKNQTTSSDDMQQLGKVVLKQFSNDHGKKQKNNTKVITGGRGRDSYMEQKGMLV